ncbi:hypothetical protein LEP1GSC132_2889 [Leptospira kirschneri str. 200803703]|nr:hypothetical protein LEP1GSC064_3390 [Leptospira kirschneri serovar Grippotyphosa str. Moskva]EKR07173.1 hypothetical protein LEP1GSC122_0351 [Leptospira kirschneri serovar Valbuzzi str. 200702274]EMN27441.1 hypothetical protein LEP1GSC065_3286 [Leptospira kirschneri serovar Sokoine str. RM1]EMO65734.1 hypothetical protein LEP1GSC132_2889 [Leptospira kirschneri str. 200803703]EMO79224.1 hypothetical protein LEP1GSC126_2760 [Leptospira kirschneri str. 200801774]
MSKSEFCFSLIFYILNLIPFFTKDRFYTLELLKNSIVGMNKLLQLPILIQRKLSFFNNSFIIFGNK